MANAKEAHNMFQKKFMGWSALVLFVVAAESRERRPKRACARLAHRATRLREPVKRGR